jgi:hypothetical protein
VKIRGWTVASIASFEKERKRFGAQRATRGVATTEKDSIAKVETGQWVQEARASGMVWRKTDDGE